MADEKEKEVKETPNPEDEEEAEEGEEAPPESSAGEGEEGDEEAEDDESEEGDAPPEKPDKSKKPPEGGKAAGDQGGELAEVEGETPRERALRLEITGLRQKLRDKRSGELFEEPAPKTPPAKKEIAPEKKKVLDRYKPEEIENAKQLFDAIADDMGFVRKDQLGAENYAEKAQGELNTFLDKHPEYSPENDKDGTLWNQFKTEYSLYKQPANPRDFQKIFNKIHGEIVGGAIKPKGDLNKIKAAQEKTKVASHDGGSPARSRPAVKNHVQSNEGVRFDMLKGFSDEELEDLKGE